MVAALRKYPWERWFTKSRIILIRGIDYHCSQSTMAQTIRNNASSRGLKVRLRDIGEAIVVQTDAFPHTDKIAITS